MDSSTTSDCGQDVVLTGISGRLPESDNIQQFAEQLFDGVDLVTADNRRWIPGVYGLPERSGKLKDLTHFDAMFFGIHAKQVNVMDPQLRLLLEVAHEAIVDAGLSPAELRGSCTAVYVAIGGSESEEHWCADPDKINGYVLTGCSRTMFPNRISYTYDLKGPSIAVDTACSSSMTALTQAVDAIRADQCDAAIIAGTNICLNPITSLNFHRLNTLSLEGRCASFDASANGYVRSEAVMAVLLQRRKNARRLYCTVRGARMNTDGYKTQGLTYPIGDMQYRLAKETYEEANLRPQDVMYVEAHGTGTKVGDPEEVTAIAQLFCKNRQAPLMLGSVKSNMGHAEIASGLCSIAKVVLAMERGVIPGNLHFKEPNPVIPALNDGSIKVVNKNTMWSGGLVGINSFGFGGANAHVILESQRSARLSPAEYPVPRLVLASGRTGEAVDKMLQLAAKHPHDAELHALIDAVHAQAIPNHPRRGYAVLGAPVTEVLESAERRPVWFVFSGMGSQWAGMASELLRLPTFAASIARSAVALKPYGLDLQYIVAEAPRAAFDDIIYCFVSVTAVQVALLDVLRELGVRPDGIIGHSLGEIACAYADEALSVEQAVLCAYWRGRCTLDARPGLGAMAAVGLSWADAERRRPTDVELACHNGPDNVTISGPSTSVEQFVSQLSSEGVFVKAVDTGNIAFHSSCIAEVAPMMIERLKQVLPEPTPRSARWLSTSLPAEQWDSDLAKFSSAEYHVNNLVSPVLFADALAKVPARALLIEVGPHALLQAVLRRSMREAAHVPLVLRDSPDTLVHLLAAIGKAYAYGAQPQVSRLYPHVSFPVSRGTPGLASHVAWDHSIEWDVPDFSKGRCESVVNFDLDNPDDAFIAGHNIDGRVLFPATGYIMLVWRTVAKMHSLDLESTAVVFENVQFRRATIVLRDAPLRFYITVLRTTGEFEVCEGGTAVATGTVRLAVDSATEFLPAEVLSEVDDHENLPPLDSEDIYKEFRLRGYNFKGLFCGIKSSDARGTRGLVKWEGNWITFMDSTLQFGLIGNDTRALYVPTRLQRLVIDPKVQREALNAETNTVPIKCCPDIDVVVCGGVECRGMSASRAPHRVNVQATPTIEKHVFVPFETTHFDQKECSRRFALSVALQLVIENCSSLQLTLAEFAFQRPLDELLLPHVMQALEVEPSTRRLRVEATLAAGGDVAKYTAFMEPLQVKVSSKSTVLEQCNLILDNNMSSIGTPIARDGSPVKSNGLSNAPNYELDSINGASICSSNKASMNGGQKAPNGVPTPKNDVARVVNDVSVPNNGLAKAPNTVPICDTKAPNVRPISTNGAPKMPKDIPASKNGVPMASNGVNMAKNGVSTPPTSVLPVPNANGDFVLLKETVGTFDDTTVQKQIAATGLRMVSHIRTASCDYMLLRRVVTVPTTKVVIQVRDDDYAWVEELKDARKRAETEDMRVYVWSNSSESGVQGLGTCLQREPGGHRLRVYYIPESKESFNPDAPAFKKQVQRDLAFNVLQNGVWGTYRHLALEITDTQKQVEHAHVITQTRGDLSSLCWVETDLQQEMVAHHQRKVLCHIYYSSLNFRDIMIATGKIFPEEDPIFKESIPLGFEFSGCLPTGKRVMGIVPFKGLATTVIVDESMLWKVPIQWSLEEAATVPVAYMTAYYALTVRGRMRRGESILIHAGAGGVGQAAIAIALNAGCTVFTTVGMPEKRDFLLERFPQLLDANIGNSRDCSFQQLVLSRTRGRGVDLVLNSLAGDKLQASVRCLATGGRFLEIGKVDLSANRALGMAVLLKNTTVHGIMLDTLFNSHDLPERKETWRCMDEGIASGVVRPLPATVYPDNQLEQAFRYMATGKHIGKVLIRIREETEEVENGSELAPARLIFAIPRTFLHPGKSYVLVGGLGGFGLELGEWLKSCGARTLVFNSRNGVRTGYQAWCIRRWREAGIQVQLSTDDVTTVAGARALFRSAAALAPIGGVFNVAVVLRDAFLENQTPVMFHAVAAPKIDATRALDLAARELAPELEHFVVFSSVTCGRGNAGQSNYGLANSAMERVCERRQEDGLPALAVQWGAVGDVGVLAAMSGYEDVEIGGTVPQRIASCLATLGSLLASPHAVVSSLVLADRRRVKETSAHSLVQAVANILGFKDLSKIPETSTLAELGMDSLMSAEIKQTLERGYDLMLSVQEIRALTFSKLRAMDTPTQAATVDVNKQTKEIPLVPEEVLVKLPSLPPGDPDDKPVFMVHSIDGVVKTLRDISASVRGTVYGIQCARSAPLNDIETLAGFYLRQIRAVQPHPPYTLLGYSFGTSVVFEMALQLELKGCAVQLVLVDGSPDFVTSSAMRGLKREVGLLTYVGSLLYDLDPVKVTAELNILSSWEARLARMAELVVASGATVETAVLSEIARSFRRRLEIGNRYKPASNLCAPVTLFAASCPVRSDLDEDYGLRALCAGELRTRRLPATHGSIVAGAAARTIGDYVSEIIAGK
ncbi:fatty acid synthase-like [Leguminivora glycinivorella]|uniref:fatty acid synthase-like n=1 Tax=Leguminivora glycinivorella TaxID=1035111 RepID=UPI00200BE088|nr:fatty acid synthase-like [Leguminivora glycinivorella]